MDEGKESSEWRTRKIEITSNVECLGLKQPAARTTQWLLRDEEDPLLTLVPSDTSIC